MQQVAWTENTMLPMDAARSIVRSLDSGHIVCVPGNRGYHLLVNALDAKAILALRKLRKLKDSHPFALLVRDESSLAQWGAITTSQYRLMKREMADETTFLINANKTLPKILRDDRAGVVGLKFVKDAPVLNLILELSTNNTVLASTIPKYPDSGEPMQSPEEISNLWQNNLAWLVDAGNIPHRESKIIDFTQGEAVIVRDVPRE